MGAPHLPACLLRPHRPGALRAALSRHGPTLAPVDHRRRAGGRYRREFPELSDFRLARDRGAASRALSRWTGGTGWFDRRAFVELAVARELRADHRLRR